MTKRTNINVAKPSPLSPDCQVEQIKCWLKDYAAAWRAIRATLGEFGEIIQNIILFSVVHTIGKPHSCVEQLIVSD